MDWAGNGLKDHPFHYPEARAGKTYLQPLLQKSGTTIRSIGEFIREAPVTNKEYEGLENTNSGVSAALSPQHPLHPHFTHQNLALSPFPAPAAPPTFAGGNERSRVQELRPFQCPSPKVLHQFESLAGRTTSITHSAQEKGLLLTRTKGSQLPNSSHI